MSRILHVEMLLLAPGVFSWQFFVNPYGCGNMRIPSQSFASQTCSRKRLEYSTQNDANADAAAAEVEDEISKK